MLVPGTAKVLFLNGNVIVITSLDPSTFYRDDAEVSNSNNKNLKALYQSNN
jgi:hypothetical protein